MECSVAFLFLLAIGSLVFLVKVRNLANRALARVEELYAANNRAWELLTSRIRTLEREMARLKGEAPELRSSQPESSASAVPIVAAPEPAPAELPSPLPAPPAAEEPAPPPVPESTPPPPLVSPALPAASTPPPLLEPTKAAPIKAPPAPPLYVPPPPPVAAGPSFLERMAAFNWEELLGTQVFLRLGVAVVVLGVVLFLGLVFTRVGPVGKVSMGVGAALAMILGGLWGESLDRWRAFGRAILAGGWGVLYFTAYATRFVEASRVIDSTPLALMLLMTVAAGAVLFSLRYRQEWTTAFAFLLIYLSLGMAAVELQTPFTLPAALVASTALGYLGWQMGWARLLGLGAIASWGCLGLGAAHQPPGGLALSLTWLCLLGVWGAFVWPVLAWKRDPHDRWLGLTLVASGMTLVGLGLKEGFAAAPDRVWILPLVFGVVGLASSFVLRRQARRGLFQVQALMAILALGLVGPLRLGFRDGWLPVLRLLGLEALLAAGAFLRERFFRVVAVAGFLLTFLEIFFLRLGIFGPDTPEEVRLATLLVVTLLSFANSFLLRRPWRELLDDDESKLVPPLFSIGGALFLACLVWLHAPPGTVALLLLASALLFQELAEATGHGELRWLAIGLAALSLVGLFAVSLPALALDGRLRVLAWGLLSFGFYLAYGRATFGSGKLSPQFRTGAGRIQLAVGLALALGLVAREGSSPWVAPLMALLALLHLGIGLRLRRPEWIAASGAAWLSALLATASFSWSLTGSSHGLSRRLLSAGGVVLLGYGGRLLLRRAGVRGSLERILGWGLGVVLPLLLAAVVWVEASPLRVGPLLALALLVHAWWAMRGLGREGLVQVVELFAASLLALAILCWPLGSTTFFSPRLGAVALTILGWYLVHFLLLREERRGHPLAAEPAWPAIVDSLPLLGALGLALAVKGEALAHDKNLLVSLVWGLLALLHLEGAIALARRVWFRISATAMAAGAVHLLLVNVPQSGDFHGISFRSLTVLPFLGFLAYAHFTVDGMAGERGMERAIRWWKGCGIVAGAILGASFLLYELHRGAVIAAWGAMALGYLWSWSRWRTRELRWSALGLLASLMVRAFGVNLALRDEFRGVRLNLLVVPATCVLLLLSFLLLKRDERGSTEERRFGAAGSRLWLLGLLVLTTAHFWVEASGKVLTIWWSLEGLAAVAVGFLVSERWARLAGLFLLSFCILKLFVYDLRGLEGMPRIFSFIVLGLVLVGVSWVYTRFKERLL